MILVPTTCSSFVDCSLSLDDPYLYRTGAGAVIHRCDEKAWHTKITICCPHGSLEAVTSTRTSVFHCSFSLQFCAIHGSLGLVNLEISQFSVDDRQANYFTPCACTQGKNARLGTTPIYIPPSDGNKCKMFQKIWY